MIIQMKKQAVVLSEPVPRVTIRDAAAPFEEMEYSPVQFEHVYKDGTPKPMLCNLDLILSRDPDWTGAFYYDEFLRDIRFSRDLRDGIGKQGECLSDDHIVPLLLSVQHDYGINASKNMMWDAVNAQAFRNPVHPVKLSLEGVDWDGQPRLDTWLTDYLAVEDTPLSRAFGARFPNRSYS